MKVASARTYILSLIVCAAILAAIVLVFPAISLSVAAAKDDSANQASATGQATANLRVNRQRINDHLSSLSKFGANPQGAVSRVAYTEADLQGRPYAIELMTEPVLHVRLHPPGHLP